jgi:hypothetical protein
MSQSTAVRATRPAARPAARPAGRQPARTSTPLLVVGAPAHARSRAGLVIGCLALLGGGLLCLLVLNVSLEKGAYVLRQQQSDTNRLMGERQALQEQLAALEAPQSLARRASDLGMVSAPNVAFVRADGQVLGVPTPGVASRALSVTYGGSAPVRPVPSASPAPSAAAQSGATAGTTKATAGGKPAATVTSAVKNQKAVKPVTKPVRKPVPAAKPVVKAPVVKAPVTKKPPAKKPVTTTP